MTVYDFKERHIENCYIPLRSVRKGNYLVCIMEMEIDLRMGRIKIPSHTTEIAPYAALAFSIGMLFNLCIPPYQLNKKGAQLVCSCADDGNPIYEMQFLLATGFQEEIPSNDWLSMGEMLRQSGQNENVLHQMDSTSWKEVSLPGKNASMTMYKWKRPDGSDDGRQESFEVGVSFSSGGIVNKSFDSDSEKMN